MRPRAGYLGFIRTPNTTAASGVWTLREAETFKRAGTWPTGGDPYWTSVSLLLKFDGTGSTITDSSSSPKTVTAFGNATQSATQSKFGGKSLYLDGTGDYLTIASDAAFGFGTGDFTIEFWYFPTQNVGNEAVLDLRTTDAVQWLWFGKSSGGAIRTYDAANVRTGGAVTLNAWNHVAWSRVGGENHVYLDGTRVINWTNGGDVGSTRPVTIGANADKNIELSTAYIDSLRITKGVGRYQGATIDVPTAEFPTE